MKYEIKGNNLPYLVCYLNKDQSVVCEGGSMSWMTPNIQMNTSSNGGIGKVFSRMFSGEKLFQNIYTAQSDNGLITFASSFPGTILPIEVGPGKEVICQKKSFLAGTQDLELSVHFRKKIGVGIFGGEGFIMQKVSGNGMVFIEIDGSAQEYILQPGQRLVVSTGHLVMMDATCNIDIETVKGIKNVFLGGQGLFNTVITGPGRVILQSMPISKTANTLASYMPLADTSDGADAIDAVVDLAKLIGKK